MKKLLSAILAIAMMLSLAIIATSSVSAQSDAWDGFTYSEAFSSGSGTEADPYIIMNGNDLYKLSYDATMQNTYLGTYFKLGDDINLGGNIWTPIGPSSEFAFSGHFDGNGKTIFNFEVMGHPAGLFGCATNASFRNIKVDHATILNNSNNLAGALAAKCSGCTIENIEIGENVTVGNTFTAKVPQIGGVVGLFTDASSAKNIINRADIKIENCTASGFAGGVFGVFGGEATVDGAINYGDIVYTATEAVDKDSLNIGGIVGAFGAAKKIGTMKNVINYGNIETVLHGGGIIGRTNAVDGSNCENAFNLGNVKAGTNADGLALGGLIVGRGNTSATMKNCVSIAIEGLTYIGTFAEGNVIGDENSYGTALSADEMGFIPEFKAITESVPAAMPQWNTVTPDNYEAPVVPDETDPEETEPEETEPEETKPEETKPEETKPEATEPTQTPSTDAPGTEKPAEGGCGSVVAGGLAILAVVALAGVALKKRD